MQGHPAHRFVPIATPTPGPFESPPPGRGGLAESTIYELDSGGAGMQLRTLRRQKGWGITRKYTMALSRNSTSDEVSSRATATCTRPGQLLPGSYQQCSGARITLLL